MKIYTRKGDTGQTQLLNGHTVSKADVRIASYGSTDELNSFIGMLIEMLNQASEFDFKIQTNWLRTIQNRLFDIGAELANPNPTPQKPLSGIKSGVISTLEQQIDEMSTELPKLVNFILPGGHPANAAAHVCRTICRRAERDIILLVGSNSPPRDEIISFMNRLSDWFFTLARFISLKTDSEEVLWEK